MPSLHGDAPLIITAALAPESFKTLDQLRRTHFPARLNKVPAHISLFHHLPGADVDRVVGTVTSLCQGKRPFDLTPHGVRFLGRGVAIVFESDRLQDLHAALARHWQPWLTPQDRQPFRPHVTIQNKAPLEQARSLFEAMKTAPLPACRVEGVSIWRYLGGPWETVTNCSFMP